MTRRVLSISLSGLLAFVATFVASAPWWRAFPVSTLVPLLLGAAAISVLLPPLVALGLRRSATTSIVLSIVAFFVYALGVTLQNIGAVDELLQGFTQGLARLLSVALPVSQPRWLYVAPVALTWLTGAATSELLTRDTGSGVAALLWAASFALAFSVTAGAPGTDVGWAVVLVVVAGFLVALRRYLPDLFGTTVDPDSTEGAPGGRRLRARPLAFGAASLAAAALIGIFAIPAVPALKAAPVTPARQPPVESSTFLTPTATMVELRNLDPKHPSPLFDFSANRTTSGYVSLADLDAYDGSIWSFTRTFHPTGGRVPPAVGAFADLRQPLATAHYEILRSLDFPWMPYVDRPADVTGLPAGFGFDALTGMVVPEGPLDAGAAYTVVSQPTAVTLATLSAGQLSLGFVASPDPEDTLVPVDEQASLSGVIKILQRQTGATAADPLTFLHTVAGEFRTKYRRLDPSVANDTTFADAVNAVLTNHKATPEEFATVFALIARQLGVPARLVTGFRLAGPGSTPAPTVAGKTYTVTSADAWTWVELPVSGLGWVVADPTPSKTGTPAVPTAAPPRRPRQRRPPDPLGEPPPDGHPQGLEGDGLPEDPQRRRRHWPLRRTGGRARHPARPSGRDPPPQAAPASPPTAAGGSDAARHGRLAGGARHVGRGRPAGPRAADEPRGRPADEGALRRRRGGPRPRYGGTGERRDVLLPAADRPGPGGSDLGRARRAAPCRERRPAAQAAPARDLRGGTPAEAPPVRGQVAGTATTPAEDAYRAPGRALAV